MAFSVKAVVILSSSHFLRSILAKSEFDKGFVSPAVLVVAGFCAAAVPFSTLPAGSLCRCSERGSNESWVRPLPLLQTEIKQHRFWTGTDLRMEGFQNISVKSQTYDPKTWRGIKSAPGLLEPGLSITFLRGGLLMATEILLPSTSMPSIFRTAWDAWASSPKSTYARPCRATQKEQVNTSQQTLYTFTWLSICVVKGGYH